MNQSLAIPWGAWNDEALLDLLHPQALAVQCLSPADALAWTESRIQEAIRSPIGAPALADSARQDASVCIAVDDLARPTRAGDILPALLQELHKAGISPKQCVILVATGTHGAPSSDQVQQKIGQEAFQSGARIEIHDQQSLQATGIIYGKQELKINRHFWNAGLKIGISSVLPHSFAGFSGGAKMMLPGLADVAATARSHKFVQMGLRGGHDLEKNRFRQEIEDLARSIGFEFTICVVTNSRRETCGVYAGDIVAAHRAACEVAEQTYATRYNGEFDAIILNAYPKDGDLIQAENAMVAFKRSGMGMLREDGIIVLSTSARELGQHGLFGPGGESYRTPSPNRALRERQLWIFAPNLAEEQVRLRYWTGYPYFDERQKLWDALLERLGTNARVGVLPCAPMQILTRGTS